MHSSVPPDSHFRPAPGLSAPSTTPPGARPPAHRPSGAAHGPYGGGDRLTVGASKGFLGLLVAMVGTVGLVTVIAIAFSVAGASNLDDNSVFALIATLAGDVALVGAALGVASDRGRVSLRQFGFRAFRPSALGWVVVAFFGYLVLAGIYSELVNPPQDDLPEQLGADESTLLAVITGTFVIAVAPVVEELFFRGFLFQAFRNSWGLWLGALGSALVFAGIHLEPDKFVQLAVLGLALAFLFHKTDSLWPCIMLHAINNIIAFAVTM